MTRPRTILSRNRLRKGAEMVVMFSTLWIFLCLCLVLLPIFIRANVWISLIIYSLLSVATGVFLMYEGTWAWTQ